MLCDLHKGIQRRISIHALRVEGDYSPPYTSRIEPDISIHALRVEGDLHAAGSIRGGKISIHALRVEGD